MRLQIVSDLHCDFHGDHGKKWATDFPVLADTVVVAGDLDDWNAINVPLEILCKKFKNVVYVAGNHEHWGISFKRLDRLRKELLEEIPGLNWLHDSMVEIDGRRFLGGTMWFRKDPMDFLYRDQIKDWHKIEDFADNVYEQNRITVKYLRDNIQEGDIVVTHHAPSEQSITDKYKWWNGNRFYVCHMEGTMSVKKPALFIHGHLHNSVDYMYEKTRVVCNPYGYKGYIPNASFDENKVVEI